MYIYIYIYIYINIQRKLVVSPGFDFANVNDFIRGICLT